MFDNIQPAPPDAIFGLTEAFKRDRNPAKISLSAGVYKDGQGRTPVFGAVKRAEAFILEDEATKDYLGIDGMPEYATAVQSLIFGADHPVVAEHRAVTAHAVGGTGALRVASELIKKVRPEARVWISQPTWPNHPNVFRAAGLAVQTYPYFRAETNELAFDEMMRALGTASAGDVLLLHGSCHNPTGLDLDGKQWKQVADLVAERDLVSLVDFAYQGLADGLDEDAAGLLTLCRPGREVLIASSFSKNFGLYNERVGALTLVAGSQTAAQAALSHIKAGIRANYSNPPAHGAKVVTTILGSPELRDEWTEELAGMRERIWAMRRRFVAGLAAAGVQRDFSFIERQRGMFSFTGLTKEQVMRLRDDYSIYILDSGRINVAGMTEGNVGAVCKAISEVLQG